MESERVKSSFGGIATLRPVWSDTFSLAQFAILQGFTPESTGLYDAVSRF